MRNIIFIFLFLNSCSILKPSQSLKSIDKNQLLDSVKLVGEGKGRLTIGNGQYVFGVESILNEKYDWIMAISIPLHGEETLILPDLKFKSSESSAIGPLEIRIKREFIKSGFDKILPADLLSKELRAIIRFNLVSLLGEKRLCKDQIDKFVCQFDGDEFHVIIKDKEIFINRSIENRGVIQLTASNFSGSFFDRTEISYFLTPEDRLRNNTPFRLELFW
jgi:hypothetical protein